MVKTDEELIALAKEGDETALELLFRRYENKIFGFLYRMIGDHGEAEDATMETFVAAMKALDRYEEQGKFSSWLFSIAKREGLRIFRKRKRIPLLSEDLDEHREVKSQPADETPKPDQVMQWRERRESLAEAINRLPDLEKEVVHLRLEQNMSFKEIAVLMDCSINTALGRMHNAVKRLRTLMETSTA